MTERPQPDDAAEIATEIDERLRGLAVQNTPNVRLVRVEYSWRLRAAPGEFVLQVARELRQVYGYRSVPYELIENHREAYRLLDEAELESLGQGLDSWWSVDSFARTLAGPAWRDGLIGDAVILKWAQSPDYWWRRAALVSTVALNLRSKGGKGDVPRTLIVCRLLVDDHEDMVQKALSWALRELVPHDPQAVEAFLQGYERRLGGRVKRETRHKLKTGLKSPRRGARHTP